MDQNGLVYKTYFIVKENDDVVTLIKYGPRFKKFQEIINEFFVDCEDLVEKITSQFFGKDIKSVPRIIEYYNKECN